jgi:hypothetical protein
VKLCFHFLNHKKSEIWLPKQNTPRTESIQLHFPRENVSNSLAIHGGKSTIVSTFYPLSYEVIAETCSEQNALYFFPVLFLSPRTVSGLAKRRLETRESF